MGDPITLAEAIHIYENSRLQSENFTQEEKDALTADAVEKAMAAGAERLRGLEKKLALSDPNVAEFKIRFNSWREAHQKMMEVLDRIALDNEEQAARFHEAVKAAAEQWRAVSG